MELKAAFPKTVPVLAGYLFLGITYGILAVTSGLPAWDAGIDSPCRLYRLHGVFAGQYPSRAI